MPELIPRERCPYPSRTALEGALLDAGRERGDDLLAALTERCRRCWGTSQVAWCAAWGEYLCHTCRDIRVAAEVKVSRVEAAAMAAAAREARS